MRLLTAAFVLMFFSTVGAADRAPLSVKGWRIGQALPECPASTTTRTTNPDGHDVCVLAAETYANEPASIHLVHAKGSIVAIAVVLSNEQARPHSNVSLALFSNVGPPNEHRSYLHWYLWRRDRLELMFDGRAGLLYLTDRDASRDRERDRSAAAKKDM